MRLSSILRFLINPLGHPGPFPVLQSEPTRLPLTAGEQAEELSQLAKDASGLMSCLVDELLCGCPWDGNDRTAESIDERVQRLLVVSGGATHLPAMPAEGFVRLYAPSGFTAPGLASPEKAPYEDLLGEQKSALTSLHESARDAMFAAYDGQEVSLESALAMFADVQQVITSRGLAPRPYFLAA